MRISKDFWLLSRPIAHRGLWGKTVVENSITAYKLASEKGYPIEIDLYETSDGEIVSFHDQTLERLTGEKGYVYDKTLKQIKSLKILGSEEKIPTFDEVLKMCEGKSPLLIEIKNQPSKTVVKKIVDKLKDYKGEFAIQSFNPLYIKKVKRLAPQFIRGILGTKTHAKGESFFKRFILKNLTLNFLIKPDFISYSYEDLPLKKSVKKNLPVIAWTVTDLKIEQKIKDFADNIIFENYIPEKYNETFTEKD